MNDNAFFIVNHGSIVGFMPLTQDAVDWWAEHVEDGPVMGSTFYVEHRYAGAIIESLQAEDLA